MSPFKSELVDFLSVERAVPGTTDLGRLDFVANIHVQNVLILRSNQLPRFQQLSIEVLIENLVSALFKLYLVNLFIDFN